MSDREEKMKKRGARGQVEGKEKQEKVQQEFNEQKGEEGEREEGK